MELKDAIKYAVEALSEDFPDPYWESREIFQQAFNLTSLDLVLHLEKKFSEKDFSLLKKILLRRKKQEPLAYILGETYFFGEKFYINKNVLIPRPDTERSVEVLLTLIKDKDKVLEVGCGSGCVSLICALKKKEAVFHGVDISPKALEVAKHNQEFHERKNAFFWQSDLFSKVSNTYDIIYSNPPYIPSEEISHLMDSVKNYEPLLALDGGREGLFFYQKIVSECNEFLTKGGHLVFEIGYNQKESVSNILLGNGFYDIKVKEDYNGHPRVIYARKKE